MGIFWRRINLSARKRYASRILAIDDSLIDFEEGESEAQKVNITNSHKDEVDIHPHKDDLVVITIQCDDREIKRVLIDQGGL